MKIYATADTHGFTKEIEVPACDLFLHAGDICADGYKKVWCKKNPGLSLEWFETVFMSWFQLYLDDGWVKKAVFTFGNHDWISGWEASQFNRKHDDIKLVVNTMIEVDGVKIWATPWSNQFLDWAWMKEPEDLASDYAMIPEGIDILLSHQPPAGFGDTIYPVGDKLEDIGSKELAEAIKRIKPKAVVCGHLHSAIGLKEKDGQKVYGVSFCDEQYRPTYQPTEIIL